jgi:hypothetical protein
MRILCSLILVITICGGLLAQNGSQKVIIPNKNPQKVKSRIEEKEADKTKQERSLPANGIDFNSAVKKVKVKKIENNKNGLSKKRQVFGSALTSGPPVELQRKLEEPTISREELQKILNKPKIVRKKRIIED